MRFIGILTDMKERYSDDCIVRQNGTILLGPGKMPKSRHMLFLPLTDEYINSYLVSEYKNKFPEDYIQFLRYSNGANLYTVKLNSSGYSFAYNMLVIFGLPLTPPFGRAFDMEEPFDVRVEDMARHDDIPQTWLKCGTYIKDYNFDVTNDIFIDTVTNQVFSCEKNTKAIVDSWANLDDCFCSIYQSLANSRLEYDD